MSFTSQNWSAKDPEPGSLGNLPEDDDFEDGRKDESQSAAGKRSNQRDQIAEVGYGQGKGSWTEKGMKNEERERERMRGVEKWRELGEEGVKNEKGERGRNGENQGGGGGRKMRGEENQEEGVENEGEGDGENAEGWRIRKGGGPTQLSFFFLKFYRHDARKLPNSACNKGILVLTHP